MNKIEFLEILKKHLKGIPETDIKEFLYDYEEHFNIGINEERSEEEISRSLGNPRILAKEIKADFMINRVENSFSITNFIQALFATVSLGFLNLVFVLGPFIAIASTIFALFISGIAIIGSGLLVILVLFLPNIFNNVPDSISGIFVSLVLVSFGGLWTIASWYLGKYFYLLTIKYLKFNVNIIKNRREKND